MKSRIFSDEQLVLYVFATRDDLTKTVTLLRSNYKFRAAHSQLFSSRCVTDNDLQQVWNV
ncbi:unnamed protein product, partial [Nesidiocoris tenuis]